MNILFALVINFAICQATTVTQMFMQEWRTFKISNRRSFPTRSDELQKLKTFMENKYHVAKHNERFKRGEVFFETALNKYSDWSSEDFDRNLNGFNPINTILTKGEGQTKPKMALPNELGEDFIMPRSLQVPKSINWTELGCVTSVKDQGRCGSCYAISALGALEGQICRKNKTLLSLSVQNIIDCSEEEGNDGCQGGLPTNTYNYIKAAKGVLDEIHYPYEGRSDMCRFEDKGVKVGLQSYYKIPSGDENALKIAVASAGPVAAAMDCSLKSFHFYKQGIYSDPNCSDIFLNHAVLVVGYGTDPTTKKDYWLVKNSWGKDWGENGYVRVERNAQNMCGIATVGHYPKI